MKILQVANVPVSFHGGAERIIWELSKELSKNHEVTILQSNLYVPELKSGVTIKEGIKIITCKNDYWARGYGYSRELKKKLKEIWREFDIIHIQGYSRYTSDYALRFLKNKKPLVFTAHGFFHTKKDFFFKRLYSLILDRNMNNADYVTALTQSDILDYLKRGVKKEKIVTIPNGLNLKRFDKKEDNKLKKKYSKNKKLLLYVGRIHESKGIHYVLEAIKELDINFLIVGRDTGFKAILENKIKELNLEKRVYFINNADDKLIAKSYSIADAFVLFSEWEGFGITVIEAMAAGKPVLVSNRGALPHLVKNGKNGYVIKFKDINSLKEKIRFLLDHKKISKKMGNEGKSFSKRFGWSRVVLEYENLYKRAIKKFN